jgi:hypothetical protein
MTKVLLILPILWLAAACRPLTLSLPAGVSSTTSDEPEASVPELSVAPLPLAGVVAQRNAQLSGLDWYGDFLVLLPQFPGFAEEKSLGERGLLFALPKQQINDFIDQRSDQPLEPLQIPFFAPNIAQLIPSFDGFEAIAFDNLRRSNVFYVTVEAVNLGMSKGYLLRGTIAPDLSKAVVDTSRFVEIPAPTSLNNRSDETLLIAGNTLLTLYEVNGAAWNPQPVAHRFDLDLNPLPPIPFPNLDYRITDAIALDGAGRFWVINYFFPGDRKLQRSDEPLSAQYGKGATHLLFEQVERLVQYQYDGTTISRVEKGPIQLRLVLLPRNWEGMVTLENRGFLLVSDTAPDTLLGFVPYDLQSDPSPSQ